MFRLITFAIVAYLLWWVGVMLNGAVKGRFGCGCLSKTNDNLEERIQPSQCYIPSTIIVEVIT